jgi:REP element-mobilizing transposase RayT
MARRPRTLSNQGIYHVYSRAELGAPVFGPDGAKGVFLECLLDVSRRLAWQLHAYALMTNHFHLAVTTPGGDLDIGMHRLLSSFSNKHKAFVGRPGHVFQSRYNADLYPVGPKAGSKIDYIHLNPVAAGIIPIEGLNDYPWTSLRLLRTPSHRGPVTLGETLGVIYGLRDDPAGWATYEERLRATFHSGQFGPTDDLLFGMVEKTRKGSLPEVTPTPHTPEKRGEILRAERMARLEAILSELIRAEGLSQDELPSLPKSAHVKVNLAEAISRIAIPSSSWLAHRLHMGSAANVRKLLRAQGVRPLPQPPDTKTDEKHRF